jgi:purine-cytosine permease-like protein
MYSPPIIIIVISDYLLHKRCYRTPNKREYYDVVQTLKYPHNIAVTCKRAHAQNYSFAV